MTDKQVLEKAISIAIENGWLHEPIPLIREDGDLNTSLSYWSEQDYRTLIYRHDFAKSLWGEDKHDCYYDTPCVKCDGWNSYGADREYCWQYYLQQMVISPDPIDYLRRNMEE